MKIEMGSATACMPERKEKFLVDVSYNGETLKNYIAKEQDSEDGRGAIGRIFLGHDESLNARVIYTPEYGIINSSTFFDVLTLTTFNFHHHRLTLKSHLNDPEIIAPTSERLRQVASSLGLSQKYLDGIKFLPDGRVDIDSC